jgi:nucleotide-binding universal stress UspA family protein
MISSFEGLKSKLINNRQEMKKILFPFEMNRVYYKESYVHAIKLARNLGAELILLTAFDVPVDNTITRDKYSQLVRNNWINAYKEIIVFHDYYLNHYARVDSELRIKVDHRFIHGHLVDEFRKILHSEEIDLVVIPSAGEDPASRKNLKILRRESLEMSRTSLMVTPCERTFQPIQNIVLVWSSKKIKEVTDRMGELLHFTNLSQPEVYIVHVSRHGGPDQELDEAALQSLHKSDWKKPRFISHSIVDREPGKKLMDYLAENNIHLWVISRHQLSAMEDMFRENIFEQVCSSTRIPLLILRETEQGR